MNEVDSRQARQAYRAVIVDSEEQAQRLLSLGIGAAAMVLFMMAPALGPGLQAVWAGFACGLVAATLVGRRRAYGRLRDTLVEQQLTQLLPIDMELWHRIGSMRELPAPLSQYVEHVLTTYIDFHQQIDGDTDVELGQVQLLEAREQLWDFLDLAGRTGGIRTVLETHGHRLSDEDQMTLRQRFSEQCAGLQQIAQTFDRSVGNFAMAQILGDELGETTIEHVAERMHEIEEEFDEVKRSLAADGP